MSAVAAVALGILAAAAFVAVVRALRRGSLGDRAVAMDAITSILTCGLLCAVVVRGDAVFLDLAVVLGLLSFLTSIAVARYVERRGS
jgi:multicomponent Na+:H+ antiporter subunit F